MKKTALVTGGSGGIGSEICRVLAEDGWQVAVCYKNGRAAAEALVSELKERGLCAEVFYCDIGDKDSIDKCVAEVRDSFGMVTLLVNNAGTADIELFTDMTDEKLWEMMNVNLLGTMRMSRAVLPEMIREHSGNNLSMGRKGSFLRGCILGGKSWAYRIYEGFGEGSCHKRYKGELRILRNDRHENERRADGGRCSCDS